MNQSEYDRLHGFNPQPERTFGTFLRNRRRVFVKKFCTTSGLKQTVENRVPAIRWLRKYKWREHLMPDVIAGLTVGIYNIPQGLAYSVLASLPPVYGLYASFFPPLIYFLLGSSLHSSIGVFSLTCLMVGHTRERILPDFGNGTTADSYKGIEGLTPIDVVVALSFLTGVIQLFMALLRLDFLTSYLSDPAVSGLNFGAACHALASQIPGLLGIHPKNVNEVFLKLFYDLAAIVEVLPTINWATTITSTITIFILIVSKGFIEPVVLKIGFPFPTELIVMIAGTIISTTTHMNDVWHVKIVDHIPLGMPVPVVPKFQLMPYLVQPALSIAIVAYAVTVSMGKLMARKHRYSINTNQELLALGSAGVFSSFFSVFPTSTSLSRTLVNEESGAKSQMSGMVSAVLILCVILFLAPLLEALPMCILSCIVVVALRSLFFKIKEVPRTWAFSKLDTVIWISTALMTICFDIIEGLLAGMIVALLLVIIRTQWPSLDLMGRVSDHDYRVLSRYSEAMPTNTLILRFDAPLMFTNVETFKQKIRQALHNKLRESAEKPVVSQVVILDCSSWSYTDVMGVEAIKEIHEEMMLSNTLLMFVDLKSHVRIQYAKAGLFNTMNEDQFYPSIQEALRASVRLYHNELEKFRRNSLNTPNEEHCI